MTHWLKEGLRKFEDVQTGFVDALEGLDQHVAKIKESADPDADLSDEKIFSFIDEQLKEAKLPKPPRLKPKKQKAPVKQADHKPENDAPETAGTVETVSPETENINVNDEKEPETEKEDDNNTEDVSVEDEEENDSAESQASTEPQEESPTVPSDAASSVLYGRTDAEDDIEEENPYAEEFNAIYADNQKLTLENDLLRNEIKSMARRSRATERQAGEADGRANKTLTSLQETERQLALVMEEKEEKQALITALESQKEALKIQLAQVHSDTDEANKRVSALQRDINEVTNQAELLQTENSKLRAKTIHQTQEYQLQLNAHKKRVEHVENELEISEKKLQDYKQRAREALQNKEKSIAELEDKIQEKNPNLADYITKAQYQELESTLHANNATLNAAEQHLLTLQKQLLERETLSEEQSELAKADINELRQKLAVSENRVTSLEMEIKLKAREESQQVQSVKKDLRTTTSTVKQQAEEIAVLEKELVDTRHFKIEKQGLQTKLKSLSDQLFSKQAQIESLTSEKTALQLRLESEVKKNRSQPRGTKREYKTSNKGGSLPVTVKSRTRKDASDLSSHPIASLVGADSVSNQQGFRQRVVKAADFIDHITAIATLYLRRRPAARVIVLLYFVLVHFWVFYVTLHSLPTGWHSVEDNPHLQSNTEISPT